jgi:hypothetical protein
VKSELLSLSLLLTKSDQVYTLNSVQPKFLDLTSKTQALTEDTLESMEDIRKPM